LTQINPNFGGRELFASGMPRTFGMPTSRKETSMFRTWLCPKTALLTAVLFSPAIAQTSVSPPATKPAPAASTGSSKASLSTQVENWTEAQWEATKKEWAKDATKWADCQKEWNKQKHEGRKSWPSLYRCMTNKD
jgi:hypothetical protein